MAELTGGSLVTATTRIPGHEEIVGHWEPAGSDLAGSVLTLNVRTWWTCSCGEKGKLGTHLEPDGSLAEHAAMIRAVAHG